MMTEAQISREIVKFMRELGWATWSTEQGYRKDRGGTRTSAGIPDLIAIGFGRILFVEVKSQRGRLTDAQKQFQLECLTNNVPHQVWRSVGEAWDYMVRLGLIEEIG